MKLSSARPWARPCIGILLLVFLLWRMPWAETLHTLASVRLRWWIPALALGALGVWFRSLRLHWVLGAQQPLSGVWRSVALGYLAGLVLPAGGGELVKVRTLMKARDLDFLHAGSAVALDRMFDLAGLALGLALLGTLQRLPGPVGTLLRSIGILLLLTGIVLTVFLFRGKALVARLSHLLAHRPWLAGQAVRLGAVLDAAEHLRGSRAWARLVLLQLFLTAFETFTATIALKALPFSVPLPPWVGLQLLMFSSIGFALPLLPGAAGSLQVAYILALRPFGVPVAQALAFSLLAHLGHILLVVGHGGLAFLLRPDTRDPERAELL